MNVNVGAYSAFHIVISCACYVIDCVELWWPRSVYFQSDRHEYTNSVTEIPCIYAPPTGIQRIQP